MSASPADRTPGRTPNGTLPPLMRRPRLAADPMVRPKKTRRPPPNNTHAQNGVNGAANVTGSAIPGQGFTRVMAQHPPKPSGNPLVESTVIFDGTEDTTSLFSSPPTGPYVDIPLIMTKRQLADGLRYHVARFSSKKAIDPRNEEEFTRPVRLHRRDPRAPPGGGGGGVAGDKQDTVMGGVDSKDRLLDSKERERQEMLRAQRDAEREAEMAQVAPSANSGNQKRFSAFKKKTQQVFRNDETEAQKAGTKLRYEEALPWHLEDFDNKQTWVGTYEKALSETYAQLVQHDGKFYVTPVEKWYKFSSKAPFETLTIEEAEKLMDKKVKDPKWVTDLMQKNQEKREELKNRKANNKLYVGKSENDGDGKVKNATMKREVADVDELDFEDDFADDEENPLFEGEAEDAKAAEERIKRDHLQANVFNLKDEKAYDKAETYEKREKEAQKKLSRKIIKALRRQEKNFAYESDSDNPYSSDDDSDSEEEREEEERLKKEEEDKKPSVTDKTRPPPSSDSSTRGTNTPSNRPSKHSDPLARTASSSTLKRPGSPNLSEASGNESARKQHKKKKHGILSNLATGNSTPNGPPSRPHSPNPPPFSGSSQPQTDLARKPSNIRLNVKHDNPTNLPVRPENKRPRTGAGSDSEGAGSGAEMSDGTRKRIKLKLTRPGSGSSTPRDSRAGSPETVINGTVVGAATATGAVRSRAASPGATSPATVPFPTAAELRALIPASGTTVAELLTSFKGAVVGLEKRDRFTQLLRTVSKYERATKLLKPID
ncbi:hypothetical protein MMC26_000547 [Xylographa opegraphella]|nr:hypothetical protein [Xylographa opegraphella]